jgi:hypothetical protein
MSWSNHWAPAHLHNSSKVLVLLVILSFRKAHDGNGTVLRKALLMPDEETYSTERHTLERLVTTPMAQAIRIGVTHLYHVTDILLLDIARKTSIVSTLNFTQVRTGPLFRSECLEICEARVGKAENVSASFPLPSCEFPE